MAGKFMKIKRLVIPFISLVILTSQLTGCAMMSQADIETELANGTEIEIEIAEPDISIGNETEIEVGGKQYIVDTAYGSSVDEDEDPDVGVIENLGVLEEEAPAIIEVTIVEGQELHDIFQHVYDDFEGMRKHIDTLDSELNALEKHDAGENRSLPDDYAEQYKAWRPVEKQPESSNNQGSSGQQGSPSIIPSTSGSGNYNNSNSGSGQTQNSNGGSTGSSTNQQPQSDPTDNGGLMSPFDALDTYKANEDPNSPYYGLTDEEINELENKHAQDMGHTAGGG